MKRRGDCKLNGKQKNSGLVALPSQKKKKRGKKRGQRVPGGRETQDVNTKRSWEKNIEKSGRTSTSKGSELNGKMK